jgi:hypothetical protein
MNLKDKISVMIMTHIINVSTNPYLDNEMIVKTIRTSHDKMNLQGVTYYVYIDSFFKENYVEYYNTYVNNLLAKFNNELSDINIVIVPDAQTSQKGNWLHMINNCNTPYFMFLEHDWEFIETIPTDVILTEMDKHDNFSYLRFSGWGAGHAQELRWDKDHGAIYEPETKIGVDVNLPLTKVGLYSGNPHIVKTQKCKDFYAPVILAHYPDIKNRNTYLEKEFLGIIMQDIRVNGQVKSHEKWGTFLYGTWPQKFGPVIAHLGDWCRKS